MAATCLCSIEVYRHRSHQLRDGNGTLKQVSYGKLTFFRLNKVLAITGRPEARQHQYQFVATDSSVHS